MPRWGVAFGGVEQALLHASRDVNWSSVLPKPWLGETLCTERQCVSCTGDSTTPADKDSVVISVASLADICTILSKLGVQIMPPIWLGRWWCKTKIYGRRLSFGFSRACFVESSTTSSPRAAAG